jgi:hypothetical protein
MSGFTRICWLSDLRASFTGVWCSGLRQVPWFGSCSAWKDSNMSPQIKRAIGEAIESAANLRPSALEFEMAYQARVAADRIRFAIRQTEIAPGHPEAMREAGMQFLDALQRLEYIDHRFQNRSRWGSQLTTRLCLASLDVIAESPSSDSELAVSADVQNEKDAESRRGAAA